MAKRKKYALIILAVIVMLAFSFVGFFALNNQSDSAENTFKSDLQSIASEYDTADKFNNKDKFALCRLIVSDYNGDTFGAVKSAVDSKHNIAVLQYETQTEEAYPKKVIIDNTLKNGDKVAMIRNNGGQRYLVVGVID